MRKILMTLVAVLAMVGCSGNTAGSAAGNVEEAKEQNIIEQAVELFDNATKEIEAAATAAELEAYMDTPIGKICILVGDGTEENT